MVFSFRHLDLAHDKFSLARAQEGYPAALLDRLKGVCQCLVADFRKAGHALRSHTIRFEESSEPDGFARIRRDLWEGHAWQFSITANAYGRVHGFLVGEKFFVVWLDPAHLLFPGN
jgi:hypothetical protein